MPQEQTDGFSPMTTLKQDLEKLDALAYADASGMALNDENLIAELRAGNLTARLRELGKESAKHLQKQLAAVPEGASCVIVMTHVQTS